MFLSHFYDLPLNRYILKNKTPHAIIKTFYLCLKGLSEFKCFHEQFLIELLRFSAIQKVNGNTASDTNSVSNSGELIKFSKIYIKKPILKKFKYIEM